MAHHNISIVNLVMMVSIVIAFRLGLWFGRNWTETFIPCSSKTRIFKERFSSKSTFLESISQLRIHHKRISNNLDTEDVDDRVTKPQGNIKPISKPTAESALSPSPMTTVVIATALKNADIRENDGFGFQKTSMAGTLHENENKKISVNHAEDVNNKNLRIIPNKFLSGSGVNPKPSYFQIRESDSPKIGDFHCGGSEVEGCCAFYVTGIKHAQKICDSYSDYCLGFVMAPFPVGGTPLLFNESAQPQEKRHLVYLKRRVDKMTSNFLTDFFVKSKHMKSVRWKFP